MTAPAGITAIFFREGMFYPVKFMGSKSPADEAADHAALNPGTMRIEDTSGNVLWKKALDS
ncbi:hypothetical protein [Sphingomonas sp. Leaf10]|uniref:hypothetical protein n=1 Tax=Sphingomonas sp. Leaf10 TaxID=1735676 RepID=UPI0006F90948|nr:hypothetical protein [Sphingomonas sp. Leaf10]KQM37960.1 hypothetical protein ASE59_11720 [Sphingomonas sp. Leaf10]